MAEHDGAEFKRADKLAVGDLLPMKHQSKGQGKTWWLPIVKVEPKRVRVWITVEDESTGERYSCRPHPDTRMRFMEPATLIAQAEERMSAWKGETER